MRVRSLLQESDGQELLRGRETFITERPKRRHGDTVGSAFGSLTRKAIAAHRGTGGFLGTFVGRRRHRLIVSLVAFAAIGAVTFQLSRAAFETKRRVHFMSAVAGFAAEYLAIFAFLLVAAYLLPAGLLHIVTQGFFSATIADHRIQSRRPRDQDVRREVAHSLYALVLFSLYSLVLYQMYKAGGTAVYWDLSAYPLWWLPLSFVVALLFHDTYFYWTHRLMHTRWLYRLFHAGHHRSITPTPWAILSFQPLETLPQFLVFALLIVFVPFHPAVLLAYLIFDGLVNAAGHCGHELVPERLGRTPLFKYLNHVTHHDLHHSRFGCNYGQYFNVWDRLMGTFVDRPENHQRRRDTNGFSQDRI